LIVKLKETAMQRIPNHLIHIAKIESGRLEGQVT
jgi:hypothetical protein